MKMLNIQKQKDQYLIYDEDVCLYSILTEQDNYVLHNAYCRKVAMFSPAKETFSLFQDKKKLNYDFIYETRTKGTFVDNKQTFTLTDKNSIFSFYSGRMMEKDILIGFEKKEFIFQIDNYDDHAVIFLKQPEYAVYASLFYLYFMHHDKPFSDSDVFLSHLPDDMMSFV